jgi:hypothetical protein
MLMYSGEHETEFPASLALLHDLGYFTDGKVYGCPSRPIVARSSRDSDYVYVGAGLVDALEAPANTPLLYDKKDNHQHKWINVGFADDHVEGYPAADFATLAAKMGWLVGKEAQEEARRLRAKRESD